MKEIEYIGKCLLIKDEKRILVIGDLHLGYEEALNESGVYIGRRMFGEYVYYLDKIFEKVGKVDEIVLLGDVKHVIGKTIGQEWNDVLGFLDYLSEKCGKIKIVKGQHDAFLEGIVKKREEVYLLDYYLSGKYAFLHGDREFEEIEKNEIKYWVMGNGHPAVKISDGTKVEKYKCFLLGKYGKKEVIICPSFLSSNEGTDPREYEIGMAWKFDYLKFKVVVVGEDFKDLDFGKLGELK